MSKSIIITGILLPLFLFGCQTQNKKADSKFEQDLRGLYAKVQTLSNQSKTRMEEEQSSLTKAQMTAICEEINVVAQKNGILEQITEFGVYSDVRSGEIPIYENWDLYDCLNWLEQNTTPNFMNIVLDMLDGEEVSLNNVLNNSYIRDDEKLTLVGTLAITPLVIINQAPTGTSSCYQTYQKDIKVCENAEIAYTVVAVVVSFFNPLIGAGISLFGPTFSNTCRTGCEKLV